MANTFKSMMRRLEGRAKAQIAALTKAVQKSLPRLPIGPGPVLDGARIVRQLRMATNKQLLTLERTLVKEAGKRRRSAGR